MSYEVLAYNENHEYSFILGNYKTLEKANKAIDKYNNTLSDDAPYVGFEVHQTWSKQELEMAKEFARGVACGVVDAGKVEWLSDYWYGYGQHNDINIYRDDDTGKIKAMLYNIHGSNLDPCSGKDLGEIDLSTGKDLGEIKL